MKGWNDEPFRCYRALRLLARCILTIIHHGSILLLILLDNDNPLPLRPRRRGRRCLDTLKQVPYVRICLGVLLRLLARSSSAPSRAERRRHLHPLVRLGHILLLVLLVSHGWLIILIVRVVAVRATLCARAVG